MHMQIDHTWARLPRVHFIFAILTHAHAPLLELELVVVEHKSRGNAT